MKKEEYIGTLEINGIKVDVGLDDYGQQYFFEYEKDGKIEEVGCGAYNLFFMPDIVYTVDREHYEDYTNEDYTELYQKIGLFR